MDNRTYRYQRKTYFCKDEPTSELAYKAAIKALEDAKVSAEELDMIIVATISADCNTPSTACILQEKLGAKNAAAFDLSAACSGLFMGLQLQHSLLKLVFIKSISCRC